MSYDREDMVSFGRYLLSDQRIARKLQGDRTGTLRERIEEVNEDDFEMWESTRPVKEGPEVEGAEV